MGNLRAIKLGGVQKQFSFMYAISKYDLKGKGYQSVSDQHGPS